MSIKAVITFDDSWDEDGVRSVFEDNDQLAGVVTVWIPPTDCSGCTRKHTGSAEPQTDNSDYAAALRVYEEWGEAKHCSDHVNFVQFCNKRLNAGK
jgi:hypothetical protein